MYISNQTKKKPRKPRRNVKKNPEMLWLRPLICEYLWGRKTDVGVRPAYTNEKLNELLKSGDYPPKIPNYRLHDHWINLDTVYFCGNPEGNQQLVLIDTDVLKILQKGSKEGAAKTAKRLSRIWPGLHHEPSTNGNGLHSYFVLIGSPEARRAAIKKIDRYLKSLCEDLDIEGIEVKGSPPLIQADPTARHGVQVLSYGTLAKLPRDMSGYETWQTITCEEIEQLPETPKSKKQVSGSISGKVFSEERLQTLPRLRKLAEQLTHGENFKAGRWEVTTEDFAIALLILAYMCENRHPDGSLPQERIKGLWTGLYKAGEISRGWNDHRWKEIRDFLSSRGLIDWEDHSYIPKVMSLSGEGQACKWTITDQLYQWIVGCKKEEEETTYIVSYIAIIQREEEAPLTDTCKKPELAEGEFLVLTLRVEAERQYWQWAEGEVHRIMAA